MTEVEKGAWVVIKRFGERIKGASGRHSMHMQGST